ncbi:MAG: hypothetical protein VX583_08350 [Bdellovibrionota bacterium]|nr:hypothetical protein [Pseudobdellovibrionaceae bacterium]|tara:strand:+ start:39787 stop:40278 length:492 start_codon:yes stop_codon:yes gene_type:complete
MEKISGILPATSRITTVDRSGEHPVRSGHGASFGRQVSTSEVVRAKPKLTLGEAPKAYERLSERKLKDRMHAQIVNRMSNDFFGTAQEELKPVVATDYDSAINQIKTEEPSYEDLSAKMMNVVEERDYGIQDEAYGRFANEVDQQQEQFESFNTVGENFSRIA